MQCVARLRSGLCNSFALIIIKSIDSFVQPQHDFTRRAVSDRIKLIREKYIAIGLAQPSRVGLAGTGLEIGRPERTMASERLNLAGRRCHLRSRAICDEGIPDRRSPGPRAPPVAHESPTKSPRLVGTAWKVTAVKCLLYGDACMRCV